MKRSLKTVLYLLLSVLFSFIVMFSLSLYKMQDHFDNELYDNVIRLHVLANSDSEYDQQAKIEIKDRVAQYVYELTESAKNSDEASEIIQSNLCAIEECVKSTCISYGYDYETEVVFSDEKYPVRYYDTFTFPAGSYKSLQIRLGKAQGKNWWCVLYPSLCVPSAESTEEKLEKAGVSKKTSEYITDEKYKVRFFLLDWMGF